MAADVKLLTDREVQQFIVNGYTVVQTDHSPDFHDYICRQLDHVFETEGNLGNNILPRVPEIGRVFEHPNVRGALTSLLGSDYVMNPHRHCHLNPAGRAGHKWHKDCYVYDHNLRHPRFDWILAFYYPQDTTEDMGPSAVLPAKQFDRKISSPDAAETTERDLRFSGPAGTVALIHFDAWHRASPNTSDRNRYMLKFQFARFSAHEQPTWDHRDDAWVGDSSDPSPAVSENVWDWMRGAESSGQPNGLGDPKVGSADLDTWYRYARAGGDVDHLTRAVKEQTSVTIEHAAGTPADNLHGTNPTPSPATLATVGAGNRAVPGMTDLLGDESWWVRAAAANVLYRLGREAEEAVPDLERASSDDHWWVRRNVFEAIGEIAPARLGILADGLTDEDYRVRRASCIGLAKGMEGDGQVVNRLKTVLDDESRYNRFYASLALRRIDIPESRDALMDELFLARWCPITTKDDRF